MKKKKGLKEKLEPRHKTLPQPETMHDFGELGKWSESTLKQDKNIIYIQSGLFAYCHSNEYIYEKYNKINNKYKRQIRELSKKHFWFWNIGSLELTLAQLNGIRIKYNKLQNDFQKQIDIITYI
jgi:hypothetical protein